MIRRLGPPDDAALRAFLGARLQSSFILLANFVADGFIYEGKPYQGVYAGAFENDELIGVAAHYWNDNLIFQAPKFTVEIAAAALQHSGRPAQGLVGPWEQVAAARDGLGLGHLPTRYASKEILYALELARLQIPQALASGAVRCRRAQVADVPCLVDYAIAEAAETFGDPDMRERREKLDESLRQHIGEGMVFVLEAGSQIVAKSEFHGIANGAAQIGAVFTPPAYRGRGYARSVVAGSLDMVRRTGEKNAFLFTGEENVAAQRAYTALGFAPVGNYGIILFR
jgi:RimJ/RimL family protein N-acetyltransferase